MSENASKSNAHAPLLKEVVLKCSHGGGCPVLRYYEGEIEITDDFGGLIRLTYDQLEMIKKIDQ